jgi:hypothetical protein
MTPGNGGGWPYLCSVEKKLRMRQNTATHASLRKMPKKYKSMTLLLPQMYDRMSAEKRTERPNVESPSFRMEGLRDGCEFVVGEQTNREC